MAGVMVSSEIKRIDSDFNEKVINLRKEKDAAKRREYIRLAAIKKAKETAHLATIKQAEETACLATIKQAEETARIAATKRQNDETNVAIKSTI